jgi:hypothetical protein
VKAGANRRQVRRTRGSFQFMTASGINDSPRHSAYGLRPKPARWALPSPPLTSGLRGYAGSAPVRLTIAACSLHGGRRAEARCAHRDRHAELGEWRSRAGRQALTDALQQRRQMGQIGR